MINLQTKFEEMDQSSRQVISRRGFMLAGTGIATLLLASCSGAGVGETSTSTEPSAENGQADNGPSEAADSDLPPAPKKDHPAPDFTLATLDGGELSLSALRGRPVILNFWASWCGPCRLEMPHLQETHAEQSDELVVLGVNLTQRENNAADIPAFVEEFALTFPIVLDEDGDVANLYGVRGQPASVFIDAEGIVSTVFYGPVTKSFIEDRIAEIKEL